MDRFLSKAKRKQFSEWIEGYYFFNGQLQQHYIMIVCDESCEQLRISFEIDPSTLCKCIGVDLNGINVFDGDIVEIEYDREEDLKVYTDKVKFEVAYDKSQLGVILREFVEFVYHEKEDVFEEIIDYIEDFPICDMCNDGIIDGKVIGSIHG